MSCSGVKKGQLKPAIQELLSFCDVLNREVSVELLCVISLGHLKAQALQLSPVTVLIHMCQRGGEGGETKSSAF